MRNLSPTLERRLRRPDRSAWPFIEIDKVVGAKIVDTPSEWNLMDSTVGIDVRKDGTIRLAGTQQNVITTLASTHDGTDITDLDRVSPYMGLLVATDVTTEMWINRLIAHVDPDAATLGSRTVEFWRCQISWIYKIERQDGSVPLGPLSNGDILIPLATSAVAQVVESGLVDHEITFTFDPPFRIAGGRPWTPDDGDNYPKPLLLILLWAIDNSGAPATNVSWWTTNSSSVGPSGSYNSTAYCGLLRMPAFADSRRQGQYEIQSAAQDVPLFSLGYFSFTSDDATFTTNPLDAGADPTSNSLVRLVGRARVPPGTAVRFYVRNDADTGWVQYTDGQRATALANVDMTGAGHPRKWRVELDTNGAGDLTPEVLAIGFEYVTTTSFADVAEVESVEWIVDPETLQARIPEIRVRAIRDGVHDFNSAIDDLLANNDIADLSISLYFGNPADDRQHWTLLDVFPIIDDFENEQGSHVLIGLSPLAFLRGGTATGERRLPRFDVATNQRSELVYDGTAGLNAPSEIHTNLISTQLGIPGRYVGAPPDDVTLAYLDEANADQTYNFATGTGLKKRIADSLAHEEVDAISFISGHATTSSQGRILARRMRGGEEPVRFIWPADEIVWAGVTPGFRFRRPVQFLEYGFWDKPDDPDEVYSFHQASIDNLGGGRIQGVERLPDIIGSWITDKGLAEAIGAREIARFGTGRMQWSLEHMFPHPELELGDRVAVEVTHFVAKDPNVARALRGALWAVCRIVGVHDADHRRFSLWVEDWADIIGSAEVVTRTRLDELARIKAYRSSNQTFSNKNLGQVIEFNAETEDPLSMHSTGTVTIPSGWGGVYSVEAHLTMDPGGSLGVADFRLSAGASTVVIHDVTTFSTRFSLSFSVPNVTLVAGDTVRVLYNGDTANSGATVTIESGEGKSHLSVRRVPPTRATAGTPQGRLVTTRRAPMGVR